ncbi:hypothetical protein HPP92_010056 [Vanilla planifolia]|uniref:RING-type E3 ubiquitin transferase n=1 Tax=Vanilla planifolia TaxID=51239 RepID=A0A835V5B9_VANPL|nr:hypothetical protein HPP92_010056 [Vanilla planifolia]
MATTPCVCPIPPLPANSTSKSWISLSNWYPPTSPRIKIHWIFLPLLLFLEVFLLPASFANILYADHCGSIVPPSTPSHLRSDIEANSFSISSGYFAGAERLFGKDLGDGFYIPRSFFFYAQSIRRTEDPLVYQVNGTLIFRRSGFGFDQWNTTNRGRSLRLVRSWHPPTFNLRRRFIFDLSGFWSSGLGKLCMVGRGTVPSKEGTSIDLSVVFKLKHPSAANITSSVVSGILESLDSVESPKYFDKILVMGYAQTKYEFTKVAEAQSSCSSLTFSGSENMGFLDRHMSICNLNSSLLRSSLKLYYGSESSDLDSGPLAKTLGFQPSFLKFSSLVCNGTSTFRAVVLFSNYSSLSSALMLKPGLALVAEGSWDQTKNQLCLLACRVKVVTDALGDSTVDDCTIGISLAFPAVLTIQRSSTTVGRIWSNLDESNPGYFKPARFKSFGYNSYYDPSLKFRYTKMDAVKQYCVENNVSKSGKMRYPDPRNYRDMMFYLNLRYSDGRQGGGFASPLALDETIYWFDHPAIVENKDGVWNISYIFSLRNSSTPEELDITAEGTYSSKTGLICMVGCRSSSFEKQGNAVDAKDCSILIKMLVPPINSESAGILTGQITSTRKRLDPLFFESIEISSRVILYVEQAVKSIWRMDIEITMVIISLTFSCFFVGLQLLHTKRHSDVVPSISISMLFILTLGHMIPLVLNFEALFSKNHNGNDVLQDGGGLLEVNEVIVRLLTMVAFLLQFRLLQVVWSKRSAHEEQHSLWLAEIKTIYFCLPLYIVGAFVALFVHFRPHKTLHKVPHLIAETHHSHWQDMLSYAGLILDGFLLPQFILNVLCKSNHKSLTPPFYFGTTVVRALPHAYDAYRSSHYVPWLISSYIYAVPDRDLYSFVWDIIIPCGGVLFAVLIYIQQRFGGDFIFCQRIKRHGTYEMVPISSG